MPSSLVVLAAGLGSRYGDLKQIDRIGPSGETIIDYTVFDALRAGIRRVVFVIRRDIEQDFESVIGRRLREHVEVAYAFQEMDSLPSGYAPPADRRKPWGTGHAVLVAASQVDGPFGVVNADDFYGAASFSRLAEAVVAANGGSVPTGVLVGFPLHATLSEHGAVSRAVCERGSNGSLQRMTERTKITRTPEGPAYLDEQGTWVSLDPRVLVSMNMMGLPPTVFDALDERFRAFLDEHLHHPTAEFFLPTVLNQLLLEGAFRMEVVESPGPWFGLTYKADREEARRLMSAWVEQGAYPSPLF